MAYETVIYQRDELYARVWSKPVRAVAKTWVDVRARILQRLGRT